jgi:hypothetical protein
MKLSNKLIEEVYWKQMREITMRTNRELRSFDALCSGVKIK